MKEKLPHVLAALFFSLVAIASARADSPEPALPPAPANSHDEALVRYERALSRARQMFPDDSEIAARHAQASRMALERARERAESAYRRNRPVPRLGYVASTGGPTFEAFREGLRAAGYVEGKDIALEARFTEGRQERFPGLVAELLDSKVDVLLAGSPPGAIAALKAETTTPIVIAGVSDPAGLAKSLGRPMGHVTGTTLATQDLGGDWVAVLKEMVPALRRVAVLVNPAHPSGAQWLRDIRGRASALGIDARFHEAGDASTLDRELAAIESSGAEAILVTGDPVYLVNRQRIIEVARRCALPAVYFSKLFADSGGLLAYGGSLEDSYRKAATYVARILEGAKPDELPIERAKLELVVNRRAASELGLTLPASLVARADTVLD